MAAKRRTSAAVMLLHVALSMLCCGCHHKSLRSEFAESIPAQRAPASETPGRNQSGLHLASATVERPDTKDEVTENLRRAQGEIDAGRPAQAAHFYERVLRDEPNHVLAHHRLAIIADLSQNFSAAEQHYRAALLARPADATILNDLGYSYFLQKRFEESEQVLREAVSIAGPTERAVANLALLYIALDDDSRAVDVLMLSDPDRATAEHRLRRLGAILDRDASPTRTQLSNPSDVGCIPVGLSSPAKSGTNQVVMASAAYAPRRELPEIRPARRTDSQLAHVGDASTAAGIASAMQPLPLWTPRGDTTPAVTTSVEPTRSTSGAASFAPAPSAPLRLPPAYFELRSQARNEQPPNLHQSAFGNGSQADAIMTIGHSESLK